MGARMHLHRKRRLLADFLNPEDFKALHQRLVDLITRLKP